MSPEDFDVKRNNFGTQMWDVAILGSMDGQPAAFFQSLPAGQRDASAGSTVSASTILREYLATAVALSWRWILHPIRVEPAAFKSSLTMGAPYLTRNRHSQRPVIGLTTYVERAQWGVQDRAVALLPLVYIDGVGAAGGLPVLLPPSSGTAADALSVIDALVITSGPDLDPGQYGAAVHPLTEPPRQDRDAWEVSLCRFAIDQDMPILAVCRGIQVLNTACGGTLHQHLPDVIGHDRHRPAPGTYGTTKIALRPSTIVATVLGTEVDVSCSHHQGIASIGFGLDVVGLSDDGVIEAVEAPSQRFVVGVQWHPEQNARDLRLFEALIEAARCA